MKKKISRSAIAAIVVIIAIASLGSIYLIKNNGNKSVSKESKVSSNFKYSDFSFDVNPETFEIFVKKDGIKEAASNPLPKMKVSDLKKTNDQISWRYPDKNIEVMIKKKEHYLDVDIKSTGAKQFTWPKVSAESYMLPLWEGKYIPSGDKNWKRFLKDNQDFTFSQDFSMRFFALNKQKYSIVYIAKNMFNDNIHFDTHSNIAFNFNHEFPSINKNKDYGFRIYVSKNDPVDIAQIYKNYIKELGQFKTLEEKAKENPNIKKLYGAPHFYLWNNNVITKDNIHWRSLKKQLNSKSKFFDWVEQLLDKYSEDGSSELKTCIQQIKNQDYIDDYQKNVIVNSLNNALKLKQFYNKKVFTDVDAHAKKLLNKGIDHLSEQELYDLNKNLLKNELKDSVDDIEQWGQKESTDILEDMNHSGIKKAWIGLPNWANGLMNPKMVKEANQLGYLMAPYDSYHSIQKNASPDWNTASFEDPKLYEDATITGKYGKKIAGFLGKGRKLNPTLSMPSVKNRVNGILQDGIPFNSWFVDCDATGEVYDDYSPNHITTQEQDMKARLKRLDYIAKQKDMVVGSEGGNDYASQAIAFAHGIETPVINWGDPDMRENKTSPYYVGAYWSKDGSTPDRYGKQVPIKPLYKHIYIDPKYNLPLYKLVYNDSVITANHWEWDNLKIKDEVGNRLMSALLYNVPPVYHIDKTRWADYKDLIVSFYKTASDFEAKAVTKPMTSFNILTKDRLVQSSTFGNDMKVVVNFSNKDYHQDGEVIKAKSAVLYDGHSKKVFDASKY
ncbi:hypothetical protein JOD45_003307 [Scopulibacillus daqui]|uniref:Glycosyl hydrolase family 101 n=1 Tax=Scopulibacillus daqui TaxID=1469162 RepID=A0ABS2Q6C3_9BACL|nr:glycoside hydrolase [Scopulibacillus daqui]MBM7647062.1 hypothetical protein [Scopulibacillus daqui]